MEADGDCDADGDGDAEADGDADEEAEGDGEVEADGDADEEAEGDGEVEADALGGTTGSPAGVTDGLRNADADGPCSVPGVIRAECREREGRPGPEPPGAESDELTIRGAWDPDSGASAAPVSDWTRPAGDSRMAPVSTKITAAQAATSPAVTHAGPRSRDPAEPRSRDPAGPRDRDPARAAPRERDRDRRRPECRPPPRPPPAPEVPEAPEATEATGKPATEAAPTAPGTAPDPLALSSPSTPPADGRSPGSLARQLPTRNRSEPGTSLRSAGLLTSRYISKAPDPTPNGP